MQPSAELIVAAVVKVCTVALCAYAEYGEVKPFLKVLFIHSITQVTQPL